MPGIGGVFFLLGLVVLANGSINVWRGCTTDQASGNAKRFQYLGTVTAVTGVLIVLGSLVIIASRGF